MSAHNVRKKDTLEKMREESEASAPNAKELNLHKPKPYSHYKRR